MTEDLEAIYKRCCDAFGVDIKLTTRETAYFLARSAFFCLARKRTSCTLVQIGSYVNVHHASVLHSLKRLDTYKAYYPEFLAPFYKVQKDLWEETDLKELLYQIEVVEPEYVITI